MRRSYDQFPWGQTRSYANIEGPDEGGINGNRWLVKELGYLDFQGASPGPGDPQYVVRRGLANESLWFELGMGSLYQPMNTFYGQLHHDNETFVFTDDNGRQWIYYDNSTSHPAELRGRIKEVSNPYGDQAQATYDVNDELERVAWPWGVEDPAEETDAFVYEYYDTLPHIGLLKRVTQRHDGLPHRKVEYEYYTSSDGNGSENDLKKVTVWQPYGDFYTGEEAEANGVWEVLHHNHYRYYTSASGIGFQHGLKYAMRAKASERMVEAGLDPETAGDTDFAAYADYYFEYDSDQRVTKQKIRGGSEEYTYAYTDNPDNPGVTDQNTWAVKTVVTHPDGSERRVYTNPLASVLVSIFEDKSSGDKTYDAVKKNSDGWSTEHAYPTAISSVTEPSGGSTALTVNYNASSGLIYEFAYYTTDDPVNGKVKGRPESRSVKEGSTGTPDLLDKIAWGSQSARNASIHPVMDSTRYPTAGMGSPPTVEVSNTFYQDANNNDTLQVKTRVVKPPVVPAGENGDGLQHEVTIEFDTDGNATWQKGARGYITHWQYRPDGVLAKRIDDVDTTLTEGAPAGWATPAGGGLNLVTEYESDPEGQLLRELGPWHMAVLNEDDERAVNVRTTKFTVYRPDIGEVWSAGGYATGSAPAYGFTTVGSVTILKKDKQGKVTDRIEAARECSCGTLRSDENFPQKNWEAWTKNYYDEWGRLLTRRVYHDVPAIGEGKRGVNYGETKFGYDSMGRQVRQASPGGTITRVVYDARALVASRWTGTNDNGATNSDPSGGGATGNNMVEVVSYEYDDGNFDGLGLLTKETRAVDGTPSNNRVIEHSYDYRSLRTQTKASDGSTNYFTVFTYNNFGQVIQTDTYHSSVVAGNLTGRKKRHLDILGREYKSEAYAVAPSTGTVGNALEGESWRDPNGNTIKRIAEGSEAFSKTKYDGLNRQTANYLAYNSGTSSDDNDVSGDVVVEQTETHYDAASNTIKTTSYQRFDDATGNGALNGPNGSQPKARRTYHCGWYDGVNRSVAQADFGTNGGADLTRPAAVPERSDTILVTSSRYATDGESDASIDPKGIEARWQKDAAGRRTVLIENYDASEPSQDHGANRTTAYDYNADGQLEILTLVNSVTGDQVTRWIYGTTLAESGVADNSLLRAKIYPESNDEYNPLGDGPGGVYERIEYEYNRQGDVTQMKDPNGTVHEYDFDEMGRQTQDRVTTFGNGIDDAVKRIATEYDNRGLPEKITSYDNATVGSGSIVNQVVNTYDDFGHLQEDSQSHSGAVTGATPKVSYGHENGASKNTVRRKSITYPDGRTVDIGYGSANSADDLMSRIASLKINGEGTNLADYSYFGLTAIAKVHYPEPAVNLSYIKTASAPVGDAGDQYAGYDRFGRTADMRWVMSSGGAVRDRFQYRYDSASQRTWNSNLAASAGDGQDDFYNYDGLYQVTKAARGELNINQTAIGAIPTKEETFSYDPTGNWTQYIGKSDGTTDLDQTRKNNKDNQLTQFNGSSDNVEYDKAGNATKMLPDKDGDWSEYYDLKWDGWNRLVEVKDSGAATVATYTYDGTTRRITKTVSGVVTHFYYNDQWKAIEERVDSSTDADRQYAWGIQFRNDLILRDRDTTGDGTLDERLYATHDALGNCTAILNTSGAVQERYGFTAFGVRRIMQADFSSRASSSFVWDFGFQGEFLDDETGYINYGYRYYLPYIGRWINRDPIGEKGGKNLYGFVGNDGVNWIDYLGMFTCSPSCKKQCDESAKCLWGDDVPPPGKMDNCRRNCISWKQQNCMGGGDRKTGGGSGGGFQFVRSEADCYQIFNDRFAELVGLKLGAIGKASGYGMIGLVAGIATKGLAEARYAGSFVSGAKNKGAVGLAAGAIVTAAIVIPTLYGMAGELKTLEEAKAELDLWLEECLELTEF